MTDTPPPKQPARSKARPRKSANLQTDLPLLETPPIAAPPAPAPPPPPLVMPVAPVVKPVTPVAPTALADRAARYNRHRSPLDDRPLAQQMPQTQPEPRPLAPARPYLHPRAPEPVHVDESKPKALDMAAIALRNRQARDAARDERPMAHPVPMPSARQRHERPEIATPKPEPTRPRDDTMLARAARHNTLLRDEQERSQALAQKPVETKAPVPQRQKQEPDAQSMVGRAADATKRRRQALGGPLPAETAEEMAAPPVHLATTAFVLISRNDGGRVVDRLTAWRALIEAPDVRWWLLDLGSVDDSVAHAEALHAQVVVIPGGTVAPMATLAALLRRVDADTVILADADALPDRRALRVLADVRAGRPVSAAPSDRPGVLAIDRKAWQRDGFGSATDLATWTGKPQPGAVPLLAATGPFIPRLLHAPKAMQLLAMAQPLVRRLRKLLNR